MEQKQSMIADINDAKAYEDNVYAGQEPEVIDDLLNKKK